MAFYKRKIFFTALFFVAISICFARPKKTMKKTDIRNNAGVAYQSANSEIRLGMYALAEKHLKQAYDLAISIDHSDLLCRILLSAAACKKMDFEEKYFSDYTQESLIEEARYYAKRSEREPLLSMACLLYEIHFGLNKNTPKNQCLSYIKSLENADAIFKKESYYLSYLFKTRGDIYAILKQYSTAEENYIAAANIHLKKKWLSELGMDWYSIARMRSLSSQKSAAIEAIDKALKYDRDAENSTGIASDYYAKALILLKEPVSSAQKKEAKDCALQASKIFQSVSQEKSAKMCFELAASIKD